MTLPTEGSGEGASCLATTLPPSQAGGDLGRGQRRPGERDNTLSGGVSYCSVVLYVKWKRGCGRGKSRGVDVKNEG